MGCRDAQRPGSEEGEETILGEPDESGYQKPIVIYGGIKVDSLGTLTIERGCYALFP